MSEHTLAPRLSRIEDKLDKPAVGTMAARNGGMAFENMIQVMEFSKLMALADTAIPKHLRGNPGACLAVCIQALEWQMTPFAVANKSYVVNDRLSWESQLIHAVVEQRAPIVGRLRHDYSGEGEQRRCRVWATFRGESEPCEYVSSPIGQIQPKNSPLWKTKPDLQLYYNASRDWARMYCPDVILGVYSEDELPMPTEREAPQAVRAEIIEQAQQATVTIDSLRPKLNAYRDTHGGGKAGREAAMALVQQITGATWPKVPDDKLQALNDALDGSHSPLPPAAAAPTRPAGGSGKPPVEPMDAGIAGGSVTTAGSPVPAQGPATVFDSAPAPAQDADMDAREEAPEEGAPPDAEAGMVEMPDPCPRTWIVDMGASLCGRTMEEVDKRLRIATPKPWEKLSRDTQMAVLQRMRNGVFFSKE